MIVSDQDVTAGAAEDDAGLARAAAAGDRAAQRALVVRLAGCVRNAVRYVVRGDADVADVSQVALIAILDALPSYRGEGALAGWAARIATYKAVDYLRRRRRRRSLVARLEQETMTEEPSTPGESPAFVVRRRLAQCLDTMNAERRLTVVLRLVYDCSLEEIAEETGVSLNTAKDRLRVGRNELRQAIGRDPVLRELVREFVP